MLALETNSRSPSAESARELGVLPGGASAVSVATSVSSTAPDSRSIADTLLRLALATNSRVPSGVSSISLGWSSTAIRRSMAQRRVSITATVACPQSDT